MHSINHQSRLAFRVTFWEMSIALLQCTPDQRQPSLEFPARVFGRRYSQPIGQRSSIVRFGRIRVDHLARAYQRALSFLQITSYLEGVHHLVSAFLDDSQVPERALLDEQHYEGVGKPIVNGHVRSPRWIIPEITQVQFIRILLDDYTDLVSELRAVLPSELISR